MKYRLPILTVFVTVAMLALFNREKARVVFDLLRNPTVGPTRDADAPRVQSLPYASPGEDSNRDRATQDRASHGQAAQADPEQSSPLLAESLHSLRQVPNLEAKLRVRIELMGHSLTGVGSYLQSAGDDAIRSRLELKMQVADRVASLLQVNDGRFSWLRDDLDREPRLVRIDLRRLREEATDGKRRLVDRESGASDSDLEFVAAVPVRNSKTGESPSSASSFRRPWALLGGLPRLICDLDDNFEFDAPRETRRGDIPVWVVEGRWRTDSLARVLPGQRQRILEGKPLSTSQLPAFVPHAVRLTLGRSDELPGFPYLIEFLRGQGKSWHPRQVSEAEDTSPMVAMEIYEVRVPEELDPSLFKYNPANQDVVDRTEELIGRAGRENTTRR